MQLSNSNVPSRVQVFRTAGEEFRQKNGGPSKIFNKIRRMNNAEERRDWTLALGSCCRLQLLDARDAM